MQISIITSQKIRESFVKDGQAEYLKRFPKEFAVNTVTLKDPLNQRGKSDYTILLDERGESLTSHQLANHLLKQQDNGKRHISFIIGPAEGWSKEELQRGDLLLSLSPMTFPFQLTQLILVEQIYRSYTIIKGIPYHK